jgi:diacylglycerol kinase family enzyme
MSRPDARQGDWPGSLVVVHNPEAGDGSQPAHLLWGVIAHAGYEPRYVSTDADWKAALAEPADLVVLIGGDGTIGAGMAQMAGRPTPIAMLPTGTANNLAKSFGVAGDARDVVRAWRRSTSVPFDVWELRAGDRRERFVEAFGGGLFGTVVAEGHDLEPPTLILGSELDRALHLLRRASDQEPTRRWVIEVDGADHSGDYIGVEVMNGRYLGPNIPFAPEATPGDGMLDVVLVEADDRPSLKERFASLGSAQISRPGIGRVVRGHRVRLVAPPDVALHLDGDTWAADGSTADDLEIAPAGTVNVLVGDH